ncbi:MAG: hypothetical protein GC192_12090 [Bacteroidetes bacterium]|nr:hypothetical protein [Bacteroidota bacterium]
MEKLIFFIPILFATLVAWSQPGYDVVEAPHWLNKKFINAYTINITGTTPDDLAQAWSAVLLKAGGQKIKPLDSEVYYCENVSFPTLSAQPFEVFFQTYGDGATSAYLTVWLKQGDKFLATKNDEQSINPISRLLIQFSFDHEDQLKAQIRKDNNLRGDELLAPEKLKNSKG